MLIITVLKSYFLIHFSAFRNANTVVLDVLGCHHKRHAVPRATGPLGREFLSSAPQPCCRTPLRPLLLRKEEQCIFLILFLPPYLSSLASSLL